MVLEGVSLSADVRASNSGGVRFLSSFEIKELRRDMAESSAWARAEMKRRRDEKAKQNAEHGTSNGTMREPSPK